MKGKTIINNYMEGGYWNILRGCLCIENIYKNYSSMVMCGAGDIVTPEAAPFIYGEGLVLFFTEFGCYVTIWLIILIKKSSQGEKCSKG
ncbi:unnamed protein product [Meloidogyne enterolobii]|uniref:Uncharacterized protein n=1 Tax=Meloidogyne enterolobii TaxID=390850 RepID=A0ACB1AQZ4_MELEN